MLVTSLSSHSIFTQTGGIFSLQVPCESFSGQSDLLAFIFIVVLSSSIFKKIAYPGSVRGHAASECACRPSSRRRISFMSSKEPPNLPEGKRRICRIMGCDHEGEQLDFVHFVLRGGEAVLNRNPFYSNVCKTCYPSVFAETKKIERRSAFALRLKDSFDSIYFSIFLILCSGSERSRRAKICGFAIIIWEYTPP